MVQKWIFGVSYQDIGNDFVAGIRELKLNQKYFVMSKVWKSNDGFFTDAGNFRNVSWGLSIACSVLDKITLSKALGG